MNGILMAILIVGAGALGVLQLEMAHSAEMLDDMKKMQEQLNNQVLSKPFSVADEAQVKSYIEDAQRRGEVPQAYKGKHWRPGYT